MTKFKCKLVEYSSGHLVNSKNISNYYMAGIVWVGDGRDGCDTLIRTHSSPIPKSHCFKKLNKVLLDLSLQLLSWAPHFLQLYSLAVCCLRVMPLNIVFPWPFCLPVLFPPVSGFFSSMQPSCFFLTVNCFLLYYLSILCFLLLLYVL